jgi:Mitochondrial branched-chain alpha-ketoacid dehydrogenase kinase
VYELYHTAFDRFRRIPEVRSVHDNDNLCRLIRDTLKEHLTVIPRLVMGVIEVQDFMKPDQVDQFVTTMLRSVGSCDFRRPLANPRYSVYPVESLRSSTLLSPILSMPLALMHRRGLSVTPRPTMSARYSCAAMPRKLSRGARPSQLL